MGLLLLYLRHTSASLTIQENADPDVQADLITALRRLAPADGPWVHTIEGPDDMPGHIKTMLTGVTLHVPVEGGALKLGTWQGHLSGRAPGQAAPPRGAAAIRRFPILITGPAKVTPEANQAPIKSMQGDALPVPIG